MPSKSPPSRIRRRSLVLTSIAMALLTAPAAAQSPSVDGYSGKGPTIEQRVAPSTEARPGSQSGSGSGSGGNPAAAQNGRGDRKQGTALPFTGLDLALLGGAGIALLGLGVGLRVLIKPIRQAG